MTSERAVEAREALRGAADKFVRAFTDLLHEDTAEAWQRAQDHAAAVRSALAATPAPRNGWEELVRLAAAVGDYKWLLNGRDKAGRCTLGCEATEGQYHADDCPAGVLSAAYLAAVDRLAAARGEPEPGGTCWFCKGSFPIDALIAGYDTWEESRLACLACNERMDGNWRPLATPEPDQ